MLLLLDGLTPGDIAHTIGGNAKADTVLRWWADLEKMERLIIETEHHRTVLARLYGQQSGVQRKLDTVLGKKRASPGGDDGCIKSKHLSTALKDLEKLIKATRERLADLEATITPPVRVRARNSLKEVGADGRVERIIDVDGVFIRDDLK